MTSFEWEVSLWPTTPQFVQLCAVGLDPDLPLLLLRQLIIARIL